MAITLILSKQTPRTVTVADGGEIVGRGFMRHILASVLVLALVVFQQKNAVLFAAESTPTLVVPRSGVSLQIAATAERIQNVAGSWQLVEIGGERVTVPAQWSPAMADDGSAATERYRLLATIPPTKTGAGPRRFKLQQVQRQSGGDTALKLSELNSKSLRVDDGEKPVLVYNHGEITSSRVPKNDSRRSRACYVHPVWGINGEVLTDDFPADHYHHHGVFWTWPHVKIADKEYDLWTGSNIRQKFVRWIHRRAGPVAAVVAVENGWFVGEKKVMIERVWLRAYRASNDARALDFEFVWIPIGRPVTLRGAGGKSYGGLTMRLAVRLEKEATITVPDGPTKEDLPDTRLPWADLTYPFAGAADRSGAALFVDPAHPDYPPTWLVRHYGVLCIGWPGVKGKTFPPGEPIRLNYRVWIHKTAVGQCELQRAYQGYTETAKVRWE